MSDNDAGFEFVDEKAADEEQEEKLSEHSTSNRRAVAAAEGSSLATAPPKNLPDLTSVQFNQNGTCAAISYSEGYRIFQTSPCKLLVDSTKTRFRSRTSLGNDENAEENNNAHRRSSFSGTVDVPKQVSMLFTTSLIALTGSGENEDFSPRCVKLMNTKNMKSDPIYVLSFLETVLSVHLHHERLIAVTETKVQIFELSSMKKLHSIDTCFNARGISAVSSGKNSCYLAIPADEKKGRLFIYDAMNLQVLSMIQASESPVRCIAFNSDATLLATTSDRGTIIRVFKVPTGDVLHEFRRGMNYAKITSLSFNSTSTLLCAASDHNSVHIFELSDSAVKKSSESGSSGWTSYLPSVFQKVIEPVSDVARIRIREDQKKGYVNACFKEETTIFALTLQGYLYEYRYDAKAKVCTLMDESSLTTAGFSEAIKAEFRSSEAEPQPAAAAAAPAPPANIN